MSPLLIPSLLLSSCLFYMSASIPLQAVTPAVTITPNDWTTVENGIKAAYNAGQKSVTIPPGTYYLHQAPDGTKFYGSHLQFEHFQNFTINATGATFVFEDPWIPGVYFDQCSNFTINGGTFTDGTTPIGEGTVQNVNATSGLITVLPAAGYPSDYTNGGTESFSQYSINAAAAQKSNPGKNGQNPVGVYFDYIPFLSVYDKTNPGIEKPPMMVAKKSGSSSIPDVTKGTGGTYIFHVTNGASQVSNVAIGDIVTMRSKTTMAFEMNTCGGMVFNNVTVLGAAGMSFKEDAGAGGNQYTNCTITYPPVPPGATLPPFTATCTDGFNSDGAVKGPTITNCLVEATGDDTFNIHGQSALILDPPAGTPSNTLYLNAPFWIGPQPSLNPKETLNFSNTAGEYQGQATVNTVEVLTTATMPANWPLVDPVTNKVEGLPRGFSGFDAKAPVYYKITVTPTAGTPLPAKYTWVVSDPGRVGAGFKISNCTVRNTSGRILIKSHDGTIENCYISNTVGVGLMCIPEFQGWGEADYARNITITGNVFTNVNTSGGQGYVGALNILSFESPDPEHGAAAQYVPLPAGHQNITVSNNIFENDRDNNIVVSTSNKVKIVDNLFINPMWSTSWAGLYASGLYAAGGASVNYVGLDVSSLIWLTQSTNVTVSGNTVVNPNTLEPGVKVGLAPRYEYLHYLVKATATATGSGFSTGVSTINSAVANFDDVSAPASVHSPYYSTGVDTYPGVTGAGWLAGWTSNQATTTLVTPTATAPGLESWAGNNLNVNVAPKVTGVVSREFDGSATGVDVTKPHHFLFDVCINKVASDMRYDVFNQVGISAGGTGPRSTWELQATSSGWQFLNGMGNGLSAVPGGGTFVTATALGPITAGTVYRFQIDVDPAAKTWVANVTALASVTPTVTANGVTATTTQPAVYTSPTLGFRANSSVGGEYLEFGAASGGSTSDFSIDNIAVISDAP